jgi:hypothetical protein
MKVSIEKGELVIRVPCNQKSPSPSTSGKTLSVASSHGNQKTGVLLTEGPYKGSEVIVGLNCYVKPARE